MRNKNLLKTLLIILVVLIIAGIIYLYLVYIQIPGIHYKIPEPEPEVLIPNSLQETERVSCASTAESKCYLYRCNSGYIETIKIPAPGMVSYECSDGSFLEMVREVN